MKSIKILPLFILTLILGACGLALDKPIQEPTPTLFPGTLSPTADPTQEMTSSYLEGTFLGLTYQQIDGNRLVEGRGNITSATPLRIPLPGQAAWVVAVPHQEGSLWTVVLEDGTVYPILLQKGQAEILDLGWNPLPPGTPPLVIAHKRSIQLIPPPTDEASPLTHPVILGFDPLRMAYVEKAGDLVLMEEGIEGDRLAVDVLPDARILVDESGRLLFLSGPTGRYDHGVLGDGLEASAITLIETDPAMQMVIRIEIPAPAVVEGVAPLWADLDGDGQREILVTVSDPELGARLVLYSEDGRQLAEGPPAGQGYRWRHQLAAMPLDGGPELAVYDVLRPHLDALFEVFRWRDEFLTTMEYIPGYSSHVIGSRNLDQTLAGDLDGDGFPEVVVPGADRRALSGLFYREGALGQAWRVELGGELTSNLTGLSLPDGSLWLGVGVGEELVVFGE
jgi:hypothetical protein